MTDQYCKFGEYRGYRYCVRRTEAGTVCCYVNAQQNAYVRAAYAAGLGFDAVDRIFRLHGGITYFSRGLPVTAEFGCRWGDDLVVGCDYGHFGDTAFSFRPGCEQALDPFELTRSIVSEAAAEADLRTSIDKAINSFDL